MRPLNILIYSGDQITEQYMAQSLTEDGVRVKTSNELIGGLYSSQQQWDFILVDLNGITNFLRGILPAVRRRYPGLPIIGIWTKTLAGINSFGLDYGLELDAYLSEVPCPEHLIINFPQVAARYQGMPSELVN